MGDFVYQGEHSITFTDSANRSYNTWEHFNMAPKSRPYVSSPPIKEEYVDVPGADGALDYTEVLTGKTRYGRRTGQWDFIVDNVYGSSWPEFYSKLLNTFHGKEFQIVLDDDPNYYYKGRLTLNGNFSNKDFSSVAIAYNLETYKYPIGSTATENWKWAELFGNIIYYGSFTVNGQKLHNVINDQDGDVTANFEMTSPLTLYMYKDFNDDYSDKSNGVSSVNELVASGFGLSEARTYCLLNSGFDSNFCKPTYTATGDNEIPLKAGNNDILFVGNGYVTVEYQRGKTL